VRSRRLAHCREVLVRSWQEYLEQIQKHQQWAFRGQADAARPLLTSLSRRFLRFKVNPKVWRMQEQRILRIFKRKARNYIQNIPEDDSDFEWLALMEHHGAPTRLLDFTWSPYVAAFFALESATDDAVVWAIDPGGVLASQKDLARKLHVETLSDIDPRVAGNYERYFVNGRVPLLWIGEPDIMNRRLTAQSGTFAMPSILDQPIEEIISAHDNGRELMAKLILKTSSMRDTAMRELYAMNISQATLFADLDGLARSLAYELEYHWAFDPRTGREQKQGAARRNLGVQEY